MSRKTQTQRQKPERRPVGLVLRSQARLDLSAAEGGEAKRPTFTIDAYHGGAIRVALFYRPVVIDLAGLRAGKNVPVLLDHDASQIVGQSTEVSVGRKAVRLAGVITGDLESEGEPAHKVVLHARNGFQWQASVGVGIERMESVAEDQTVKVNGQEFTGPLLVVRAGRLGEVSFVAVGADENASARIAAAAVYAEDQIMTFEEWLQRRGLDAAALTDECKQTLRAEYDAESARSEEVPKTPATDPPRRADGNGTEAGPSASPPASQVTPVAEVRAQALAETKRVNAIRRICAGRFPDLEEKAVAEGWTEEKTELEKLRASRPRVPAIHAVDRAMSGQVLEAACLLTAKLAQVEELYDEKTLDAASRRFRGGIGLQELLLEAAWANGFTGRNFRDSRDVLRFAFGHTLDASRQGQALQAGFSTVDIGGILSNVTNKFLLDGFFSVERTWRNVTAVRNVSDFKTVTSYRLIGKDQYERVAPGGELRHGTLGEEKYENKADTYGLLLSIDRRDLINDDLGAVTTVPRKLGRGSGLKINDVFWTTFLANAAFFKTAHKNYIEGADTALGIEALSLAEKTFLDQVDSDGKPIGIMPAILLVSTSLSAVATVLYKSLELRDTTANLKYPVANPHAGKFRSEVSRYLGNSKYAGFSDKSWYLLADPADLPVIEVAFLNGQESPTIETAEADFNVLGIQMRGFHDFGVALQDPRGGVKSKGQA